MNGNPRVNHLSLHKFVRVERGQEEAPQHERYQERRGARVRHFSTPVASWALLGTLGFRIVSVDTQRHDTQVVLAVEHMIFDTRWAKHLVNIQFLVKSKYSVTVV